MKLGATVRDLRRTNRSAILRELLFARETTRQKLAERTGLSPATVGLVVAEMLREGLVIEVGTQDSDGGRPRALLRIDADHAFAIGVDVGEGGLRVEAFDLAWQSRGTVLLPLDGARNDPRAVVELISSGLAQVLHQAQIEPSRLLGIGVGVSGIVERGPDAVVHAVAFGWDDVPLGRLLRDALPAPVFVDNGAKTMAQAEMWFGAGRGAQDAVVALLGTGVGAAVFTNGRLYRGSQSSAGEWGHTPIVVGGRACRCGSRGCLEAYVGGSALVDRWAEAGVSAPSTRVSDEFRLTELLEAATDREDVRRFLDETSEYLGAGLATLINLFNPERIVLAGSVGLLLMPQILERVRGRAAAYSLRQPFESVEIVLGELGPAAVALGAATLVTENLLSGAVGVLELGSGESTERAFTASVAR
ncbi:MAG TPA: ROK family transcriptional regulator [Candidatus Saccharimonadales bacterium]|nr:ROK family transcriptional regulator [Candidatus Saccharimonadales bacterium]